MFDIHYNSGDNEFIPYISVKEAKSAEKASAKDLKKTQNQVNALTKSVAKQGTAVAKNSADVAKNSAAISANATAIENEAAARESAVDDLNVKIDEVPKFKIEVVDELPATGDSATIYLVKIAEAGENMYKEYIYSNGKWEEIGSMIDLSGYATKEELEEAMATVYTKDEVDDIVAPLAVKEEVDEALALKANAADVYTKAEADEKFLTEHQDISDLATKTELNDGLASVSADVATVSDNLANEVSAREQAVSELEAGLAEKANADNVYTKTEADEKFLTEHQDLSDYATKAELIEAVEPLAVSADVETELALKADADNVYTKAEADDKFLTEHQDLSDYATKAELIEAVEPLAVAVDVEAALELKADVDTVYTKEEADEKFLTEHQDLSDYATKSEVNSGLELKADADSVYTKAEADEKFLTEHQDISDLATKAEVEAGLAEKADADNVYTKEEADEKFLTEHQDLSDYATTTELNEGIAGAMAAVAVVADNLSDEVSAREQAINDLHEEIVALPKFKIVIVDELPESGDSATFYLLATGEETGNTYTEYVFVNGAWEQIGTQSLDLTEYAKKVDVAAALATKADLTDVESLSGVVDNIIFALEGLDGSVTALEEDNAEQDAAIATKADADNVYTKAEADEKFLTEHQDISGLATKEEVEAVDSKVDAIVIPSLDGYARTADVEAEIESASTILAAKDAEQDEVIALKADLAYTNEEIYKLTKMLGDLGAPVTYELPSPAGKSFNTLMGNNGTVKLSEDVTTGRFGPGITAKNTVVLNLNSHNLTVTGLTTGSSTAAIMARGTQNITIGGKGTVDAGEGICIMANGTSTLSPIATINLSGSTTVYRNNRSGGELIYCYVGTINITNGTFRNDGEDKTYLLNCYDANYRNGTANIVVSSTSKTSGPKFYDFNPADNNAEGEHTNFVATGCEVQVSTVIEEGVEHTVYMVVKSA